MLPHLLAAVVQHGAAAGCLPVRKLSSCPWDLVSAQLAYRLNSRARGERSACPRPRDTGEERSAPAMAEDAAAAAAADAPEEEKTLNVNLGVLGHVDSGKTSLVRALSVTLSTAALDKAPEEKARGITINSTHVEYETTNRHYAHVECAAAVDRSSRAQQKASPVHALPRRA